ncbi:hypothetical protein RvY_09772 [Ramazzottius varieornatus]|uniref:Uncharacterized protein n=1 Tax=Ramazzottius varieornatus TaxID=947166 RepID=A0A1D1VIB5_RAMVA|nr:hypothetical protein RvY_09772 [Ramazzottius varieornatus]
MTIGRFATFHPAIRGLSVDIHNVTHYQTQLVVLLGHVIGNHFVLWTIPDFVNLLIAVHFLRRVQHAHPS